MNEPVFITREVLEDIHSDSLALFGGTSGVRDEGLVVSAMGPPKTRFSMAVATCLMLPQLMRFTSHRHKPSWMATSVPPLELHSLFLEYNGVRSRVDDGTLYCAMIAIAERTLDKTGLARTMRDFIQSY